MKVILSFSALTLVCELASGFSGKTCLEILSKDYYLDNTTTSVAVVAADEGCLEGRDVGCDVGSLDGVAEG